LQDGRIGKDVRRLERLRGRFALDVFRSSARLRDVDELAEESLQLVDLAAHASARAGDLSHGDKKRLDIAVALSTRPQILLLDEPVAGMSLEEVQKTDALIRNLAKRMTVLLIEHDMTMIMGISDSITVLYGGKILAEGTPAEIRANQRVQDAYLGGHTEGHL
jgi:ABC-type branched-subunit amino acid transport system ATPase component